MKKLTSYLFAFIASICMSVAYAEGPIQFILNVDNPAIVPSISVNYVDIDLVAGDNEITIPWVEDDSGSGYASVYFYPQTGGGKHQQVKSITASVDTATNFVLDYGAWTLEPDSSCNGVTYTVVTEALGTDSVIIITDEFSKVKARFGGGNITLNSDTMVAWFSSDREKFNDLPFTFSGARIPGTYDYYTLYQVLLNGVEVKDVDSYGTFSVTPADGDTIKVLANAPAGLWYPVFLNFADENARASVKKVEVDGVEVEKKDSLHVDWGASVKLYFDLDNYAPKVNDGSISSPYAGYHEVSGVRDTVTLNITAEKYQEVAFTVMAHGINCFEAKYRSGYYYEPFELEEGSNAFTINTKNPYVYLSANEDCKIDSIKVNGVLTSEKSVSVTEGMKIEVWADSIVYQDIHFAVIAHNASCFGLETYPGYVPVNVEEDTNVVVLTNKYTGLSVEKNEDCKIDSIKVNGEKHGYGSISFAEGTVIEVWADSIRRNSTFVVYVDNADLYDTQNAMRGDYVYIADYYNKFVTGYQSFKFDPTVDNSFSFRLYDYWEGIYAVYYLNDVKAESYDGSAELILADKDVVKIYATEQTPLAVTFAGNQLSTVTNVTKDSIVAVDDISLPLSVLPGTEVAFTTSETVTVNDVAHEAVDGVHTVVVTEATTIVVGEEPATGLNAATTTVMAVKQLREGQIVIIKNGVEYNVLGAEIR